MGEGRWGTPGHRDWLLAEAERQFGFFRGSLVPGRGLAVLDLAGEPISGAAQELHTVTRLVHAYALGQVMGAGGAAEIVDRGIEELWSRHRDPVHGGYVWAVDEGGIRDGRKLAYGHVFVLLAAASALEVGHPRADALLADVAEVLETRFWDEVPGRFADEWARDWAPFSTYRGMNANMHGVEALMAAHEATGEAAFLTRAARIAAFFTGEMAPAHGWRIPEHYGADWRVDEDYAGDPVFRPPGTTPGHALEWARLILQLWDLGGRPGDGTVETARRLTRQALADGWDPERGGLVYTVGADGRVDRAERYWWPVTEGIGALAALMKADPRTEDALWYDRLWSFAESHLIDAPRGGWFPELGPDNRPACRQFAGKPDIYHSLQAALYPLTGGLSRPFAGLRALRRPV